MDKFSDIFSKFLYDPSKDKVKIAPPPPPLRPTNFIIARYIPLQKLLKMACNPIITEDPPHHYVLNTFPRKTEANLNLLLLKNMGLFPRIFFSKQLFDPANFSFVFFLGHIILAEL